MTKFKRFALVLVALTLAAGGYWLWSRDISWPQFPPSQHALAPQAVVSVNRDFGWRTGDVVPVKLFIKEKPGTAVDLDNIAVGGDFEVRGHARVAHTKSLDDGSRLKQVDFNVQSLNYGETRSLNVQLSYRILSSGEVDVAQSTPLVINTSKTYDGRPDIQPGSLDFISPVWDIWQTFSLLGLAVAMIVASILLRRYHTKHLVPELTAAEVWRQKFESIWQQIQSGDNSPVHYEELERMVRKRFGIEPQTRGQIELLVAQARHPYREEIITVISLCDRRIYDHQLLTEEEHKSVHESFVRILTNSPRIHPTVPARKTPAEAGTAAADEAAAQTAAADPAAATPGETAGGDAAAATAGADGTATEAAGPETGGKTSGDGATTPGVDVATIAAENETPAAGAKGTHAGKRSGSISVDDLPPLDDAVVPVLTQIERPKKAPPPVPVAQAAADGANAPPADPAADGETQKRSRGGFGPWFFGATVSICCYWLGFGSLFLWGAVICFVIAVSSPSRKKK